MTRRPRWNHPPAFEAKATVAAIMGENTLTELVQQFDVRRNQIRTWKAQLLDGTTDVLMT